MKTAKFIYSLLLTFYPDSYQKAFGAQMMQTFIDHYTDVATSTGCVSINFWLFTVTDEIKNIMRQRMTSRREGNTFLHVTVTKLVVSTVLLIPLYAVCYAALVTAVLALPHPQVRGGGFLIALAALLLLCGILSVVLSYVLTSTLFSFLPKRKKSMS